MISSQYGIMQKWYLPNMVSSRYDIFPIWYHAEIISTPNDKLLKWHGIFPIWHPLKCYLTEMNILKYHNCLINKELS